MKWSILPGSWTQRFAEKYLLQKGVAEIRERTLINWKQIQSIAFLVDGSAPEELRLLLNRINTYSLQGKKVHLYGYVKKFPPFDQEGIYWFTNKELNWAGLPGSGILKAFNMQTYDLLINTADNKVRPLHYLAAQSHAKLRIGPYSEEWKAYYDFMIIQDKKSTTNDLLDQAEYYLNHFNQSYASV